MSEEFKLPTLGENIENGDIVNILVHEGDQIAANTPAFELETDKAVLELPCPHAGRVATIHVAKGDTVAVGQTLLTIETEQADAPAAPSDRKPAETAATDASESPEAAPRESAPEKAPQSVADPAAGCPLAAGPAARRLGRELGVDLRQLTGSGKHGRITPDDVRAASTAGSAKSTGSTATAAPQSPPVEPAGEPGQDAWGPVRRERMSKIRRTIAAQMVRSASTIPHVTNFDDADVTELVAFRKGVPPGYLGEGLKLTTMPFVLKAVAMALLRHPTLNASLDDESDEIVYKRYVNVGVAVDTPRGLVVPALRGVDRLSIAELAAELKTLAERARAAAFAVEDLRGGTFTVSNLGAVGGTYSTPIINHPEVAILLLGRSRWMPVVRQEKVETRLMMPLSLSFDHRLVDGAAAGRFLNDVIDYLQSPGKLLLK